MDRRRFLKRAGLGIAALGLMGSQLSIADRFVDFGPTTEAWSFGDRGGSPDEFADDVRGAQSITADDDVSSVPRGLDRDGVPSLSITYRLDSVPEHGAVFRTTIPTAHVCVPQLAVFSNGVMCGLIQVAGLDGDDADYEYRDRYELYLPAEFLEPGTNELELRASRGPYADESVDEYCYWEWNELRFELLEDDPPEPLHGRYVHVGSSIFKPPVGYDEDVVERLPPLVRWLGAGFSGNVFRCDFRSSARSSWEQWASEYLETMSALNARTAVTHLDTGDPEFFTHEECHPFDGLAHAGEDQLEWFFSNWGDQFEYYEPDDQPGRSDRAKNRLHGVGEWLDENLWEYENVETVAPGWRYDSENGCPSGWASDPSERLAIESEYCDLTGGHAFGGDGRYENLVETLRTYEDQEDEADAEGLPRELLVTKMGASDDHEDPPEYGASQPVAAAFDRIMRAHVSYADHFVQHATIADDYGLVEEPDWNGDPKSLSVYDGVDGNDPRLKTFRRIACAYGTHGSPLSYDYVNREEIDGEKVYFRAVDTSALPELPTGGSSEKVLLNFVNFERSERRMSVRVTMPEAREYEGDRIGETTNGATYEDVHSAVALSADPSIELEETLAGGQAVQYILE